MTRTRDGDAPHPEELLAAYADGGLDADERARVERYLESHPEAEAELDELRRTITHTRATAQRRTVEPAWDELSRAIHAEVDAAAGEGARERGTGLGAWLRGLLRPRVVFPAGALAAAAAVILVVVLGGGRGGDGGAPAAGDTVAATDPAPGDAPVKSFLGAPAGDDPEADLDTVVAMAGELRVAEVGDLRAGELDRLLGELDDPDAPGLAGDLAAIDDLGDEAPVLSADEALSLFAGTGEDGGDAAGVEVFGEPDYDAWLGDLSAAELDAVDAYLERIQRG